MPYLLNTWFSRAGHPAARLYDLKVECCSPDNASEYTDTIVMAENGDGKSSIIQLIISVFIPNKRMITGGKGFDDVRTLDSYFKAGEVAWVVLEFTVDDKQEFLFDDKPTRIVGFMAYKSTVRDDAGNFELKRHFFSFKTGSGLSADDIPMKEKISYIEACDWANGILKQHPKSEPFSHKRQSQWADFLKSINIHPELMKMQLLMNKKESNADEILKLSNINEFVDLVLTPLIDPERTSALPETIEAHRNELANIPNLRKEQEFMNKLARQVSLLQGPGKNVKRLEKEIHGSEKKRGEIADKISNTVFHLKEKSSKLQSDTLASKNEVNTVTDQIKRLNATRLWFEMRKLQILEENARIDEASSNKRLEQAEYKLKLLKAASCLGELLKVQATIRSIDEAIAKADLPAKATLEQLHGVGAALYTLCNKRIQAIDRELSDIRKKLADARNEQKTLVRRESCLKSDKVHNSEIISKIEEWLSEAKLELNHLVESGVMLAQENFVQGKDRCLSEISDTEKSIEDKNRSMGQLEERLTALNKDTFESKVNKENCKNKIERIREKIKDYRESLAKIEHNQTLMELEGVDVVIPYDAGLCARLEKYIDEQRAEHQILTTALESDQLDLEALEQNSVLPPSKDVVRVLDYFSHQDIACFGFGQYFAQNRVLAPGKVRELLSQQPAKYSGIVFQSPEEFKKAKKVPALAHLRGPVELTLQQEGLSVNSNFSDGVHKHVVLPDTDASFNGDAAEIYKQELKKRLYKNESRLSEVNSRAKSASNIFHHLKRHLSIYGVLSLETMISDLSALKEDLGKIKSRILHINAQIDDTIHLKKTMEVEIVSFREQLGEKKNHLNEFRVYEETYHRKIVGQKEIIEEKKRKNKDIDRALKKIVADRLPLDSLIDNLEEKKERQVGLLESKKIDKDSIQYYDRQVGDGKDYAEVDHHELTEMYKRTKDQYESQSDLTAKLRGEREATERQRMGMEKKYANLRGNLSDTEVREAFETDTPGIQQESISEQETFVNTLRENAGQKKQQYKQAKENLSEWRSQYPTIEEPVEAGPVSTVEHAETVLDRLENELVQTNHLLEEKKSTHEQFKIMHNNCLGDIRGIEPVLQLSLPHANHQDNGDQVFSDIEEAGRAWTQIGQTIADINGELDKSKDAIAGITQAIDRILHDESYQDIAEKIKARIRNIKDSLYLQAEHYLSEIIQRVDSIHDTIGKMDKRIETIVEIYQQYVNEALANFKALESSSRFPVNTGTWEIWSKEPFFKVQMNPKVKNPDYVRTQLSSFIEQILRNPQVKLSSNSVQLILRGVHEVIGGNFSIRALKVQSNPTRERDDIMQTLAHSGGEKATAAIYLYTTLARMVGNNCYQRKNFPSFLILDNPFGQCNKSSFLKLQREMARISNVQLIYFTGIKDTRSLSEFNRFVTLKKTERTTRGDQRVQAVETRFESITADFSPDPITDPFAPVLGIKAGADGKNTERIN
ncbi:conserved hypothetical protein [Desulforapulum autotrophicum HRM2]|uniref:Chromosome segregation ATPase n=1 Tax=Desulforapulum autotrophicum (strain ATCC 43914 / DSM 3382 / VKM B-1955 / HRM2) TaxID=177437 RepID=C0QIL8_DESAH|nr:hypothetical protein [Desulforapulum autotrophicum]ACN17962.1 conserved hypothetical protein [Desulforapulum autotrophicum HRM2]